MNEVRKDQEKALDFNLEAIKGLFFSLSILI